MTIHNLYIFDRHCQCIYFQKWNHKSTPGTGGNSNNTSHPGSSTTGPGGISSSSRLGLTTSSRFSASSPGSSSPDPNSSSNNTPPATSSVMRSGDGQTQPTMSGMAAGSVISIEEEAKLVYGVIYSLRNFVRKLSSNQDEFISYKTSTYRLHYYETPTGLKFVMNSDANTESLRAVLKQIYVQLYVEFVVKNGLMKFEDTRWEISQGFIPTEQQQQQDGSTSGAAVSTTKSAPPPPGNISNELFRIAVDRFIRSLPVFE
ncbi:Sybindin-like family-domain-containing protein [Phascolomyces articulosus]|uniref:Trafficking protein particle complex subunit n=1 Tax=Phascolomyces articulosus TaxID=60185 RepID=A0AAD5K5D8_9FUNG|nr:Sybindin-like family-domain-containing protein [Phascolomyces articulosus]